MIPSTPRRTPTRPSWSARGVVKWFTSSNCHWSTRGWKVQGGSVDVKSGWLQDVASTMSSTRPFYQIVETLDVDWNQTYVAIGYGDDVKGVMPVVTKPIISRRIILTKCGDVPWRAVDVTTVPGTDYHFGCGVNYLVLYEFMTEFLDYLVDTEFEHETTLPRSSKIEIIQPN